MGFWEECLEALEEAFLCPCTGRSSKSNRINSAVFNGLNEAARTLIFESECTTRIEITSRHTSVALLDFKRLS